MADGFSLPHSILMLGCGNMGAAIAPGIVTQMPSVDIIAIDHNPVRAQELLPAFREPRSFPYPPSRASRCCCTRTKTHNCTRVIRRDPPSQALLDPQRTAIMGSFSNARNVRIEGAKRKTAVGAKEKF